MTVSRLNIHLNTDVLTGELQIDPHPAEGHYTPVHVSEWPPIREEIRDRVSDEIVDAERWERWLASDRVGERFDVTVGYCTVDSSGEIRSLEIERPKPEDINW